MRQEYHIIARNDGAQIRVSALLDGKHRSELPTTGLPFKPARSEISYPVTVYWKGTVPVESKRLEAERAVLDYCARLFQEFACEGPVDCCL